MKLFLLFSKRVQLAAPRRGYALATVLILLGVILFTSSAVITVSILESRISLSQQESIRAYYVTEAGVEDGLWRLNHLTDYSTALSNGTLTESYTATDIPLPGESFTVKMQTSSLGPGYGTVDVSGSSTNNGFTARRHIIVNVFKGNSASPTAGNGIMSGTNFTVNNGQGLLSISGGGIYAGNSIAINNAQVNLGTYNFSTAGTYTVRGGNSQVTSGGTSYLTSTYPVPGFDFNRYRGSNNYYYTPEGFQDLFDHTDTVNLTGTVFVDGDLNLGSWSKGKTLNLQGMLIIAGSLKVNASTDFQLNISPPGGSDQGGLFVQSDINASAGNFNLIGVLYASGNMTLNGADSFSLDGALVAGSGISFSNKNAATITFDAAKVNAAFGSSGTTAVKLQHWEDQY